VPAWLAIDVNSAPVVCPVPASCEAAVELRSRHRRRVAAATLAEPPQPRVQNKIRTAKKRAKR